MELNVQGLSEDGQKNLNVIKVGENMYMKKVVLMNMGRL